MSMLSEQVNKIRKVAKCVYLATDKEVADDIASTLNQAADTIEALSAKLQAANMENNGGWILVEENGNFNFPEEAEHTQSHGWSKEIRPSDYVLCESTDGNIFKGFYSRVYNTWTDFKEITEYETNEIIRWKPLPKPYRP